MGNRIIAFLFLFLMAKFAWCQELEEDSKFILVGPSFGINKSWRTYERPTTTFDTNPLAGFEGGLNIFFKSKHKFGFLGNLKFIKTRSSITSKDVSMSTTINESADWLSGGGQLIYFPFPRSASLPFFGFGIQVYHMQRSNAALTAERVGRPDEVYKIQTNLDELRTDTNYSLEACAGLTINKFDKHRIVLLVTYSKTLGQLVPTNYEGFPPDYLVTDYSINTMTVKLMMAL